MSVIIDGDTGITVSGNISTVGMTASGNVSGNNMSTSSVGSYKSSVALTPPTFKDINNVEIGTLCRAWVNFRGATAVIDSSFNVSSVTRASAGSYTINFTNTFTDTLYAVTGCPSTDGVTYNGFLNPAGYSSGKSTTSVAVTALAGTGPAGTAYDPYSCYVAIFR